MIICVSIAIYKFYQIPWLFLVLNHMYYPSSTIIGLGGAVLAQNAEFELCMYVFIW